MYHMVIFGRLSSACCIGALLASCSGASPPLVQATSAQSRSIAHTSGLRRTAGVYRILHSFTPNTVNGTGPLGSLLNVHGTFYGLTGGGTTGNGVVYTITPTRQYNVLYNFDGSPDGAVPSGSLINVAGTLYGVTSSGGAYGDGTVFSITPSGNETVIYSFMGGTDGSQPNGPLVNVNGTLYGTTISGGTSEAECNPGGCGTVFGVTLGGYESVLHRFTAGSDGWFPFGNLIFAHGILYGTTFWGGAGSGPDCHSYTALIGCGTVYSVTTSGVEQIVHTFSGPPDGERPRGGLTNVSGIIYGTTGLGGSASCVCGTVFSINASGNETVVYSFAGPPNDGADPLVGLLSVNGTLYGTTIYGGPYQCRGTTCGTIFAITPSGTESIVHNFAGESVPSQRDAALPRAALVSFNGGLYGTTSAGGEYPGCLVDGQKQVGCGAIFEIK